MKNNNYTYFIMGAIDQTGTGYYWTKKLHWCNNLLADVVSKNPHCNFLMWRPTEAEAEAHCEFLNKRLKRQGLFGEPKGELCPWERLTINFSVSQALKRPSIEDVA